MSSWGLWWKHQLLGLSVLRCMLWIKCKNFTQHCLSMEMPARQSYSLFLLRLLPLYLACRCILTLYWRYLVLIDRYLNPVEFIAKSWVRWWKGKRKTKRSEASSNQLATDQQQHITFCNRLELKKKVFSTKRTNFQKQAAICDEMCLIALRVKRHFKLPSLPILL